MKKEYQREILRILEEVLAIDPRQRSEFLAQQCSEDLALGAEVEKLLEHETRLDCFLPDSIFDLRFGLSGPCYEGCQLGVYEIGKLIKEGGDGLVYDARRVDGLYRQRVAVKVLKSYFGSGDRVARFEQERQILAQLNHPYIARILDGDSTDEGAPYFVMEHVEGRPIDQYCREKGLSLKAILNLFCRVCEAVQFAHQNLVVHCDLKPGNILITDTGSPKLLDFGVSKLLFPNAREAGTGSGPSVWRFGTPLYMSPEQSEGRPVTTASDVYSLGIVLFKLLTGDFPNPKPERSMAPMERPSSVVERVGASPLAQKDFKRRVRQLRGDLDAIVLKAVAPEPANRYSTAEALAADLRRYSKKSPVSARLGTGAYRLGLFLRRNPAGAGVLVLLPSLVLALALLLQTTRSQRDQARQFHQVAQQQRDQVRDSLLALLEEIDPFKGGASSQAAKKTLDSISLEGIDLTPEDRAFLLDRMGRIYYRFDDFPEAHRLLGEALRLRRGPPAMDGKLIASSLTNLGLVFLHDGQEDRGLELIREAMTISAGTENRLANLHQQTNFATGLEKEGKLQQAETIYRNVLAEKALFVPKSSLEYAKSANNLGAVLVRRGHFREAEPLLRHAAKVYEDGGESTSLLLTRTLGNLVVALDSLGVHERATELARRRLDTLKRRFSPGDPGLINGLAVLAYSLLGSASGEDLAEAEAHFRYALEIQIRERGSYKPETLILKRNLAATFNARGLPDDAEALIREVIREGAFIWSEESFRSADANSVLGHSLLLRGRYEEAESLLTDAYPKIRMVTGAGSRYTRDALARIVALYRSWGNETEARRWERRASTKEQL